MSRSLDDLHPFVRKQARELLVAAVAASMVLKLTHTYRTFEEQAALYAQGRTTPGPVVTHAPPGYSWHNWRCAFDVVFRTPEGGVTYDGPWEQVGALGEALGLEWGGRWKHPDRPHFQDTLGKTLAQMLKEYPEGMG